MKTDVEKYLTDAKGNALVQGILVIYY